MKVDKNQVHSKEICENAKTFLDRTIEKGHCEKDTSSNLHAKYLLTVIATIRNYLPGHKT